MIDPKASDDAKLAAARELAEEANEHYQQCNDERALCARFYHNTGGIGQWKEKDLEYLKRQGRSPITHNILKTKVNTAIGMHAVQQRTPVVRAVGGEDKFKAEVLNAICQRVMESAHIYDAFATDMDRGYIEGEGDTAVDVCLDPTNPIFLKFEVYSADAQEIGWDPGSMKMDRSDAGYVTWERWLTKAEFIREYPEHKKAWEDLSVGHSQDGQPDAVMESAQGGESAVWEREDFGKRRYHYYDRKKRRARIIRIEYKTNQKKTFAIQQSGASELAPEQAKIAQEDEFGYWARAGYVLQTVDVEQVHMLEFCGVKILHDSAKQKGSRPPNPFDGFSVDPFLYAFDTQARVPYGMVRDLMPPQEELNKGIVTTQDHFTGQHKPGTFYEEGAIANQSEKLFEAKVNTVGSAVKVSKNALVEGRIKERGVPQVSPAAMQRIETSLSLIDRISAISSDLESPAAMNEPATSVMIRYHKSQLGLATVRSRFDTHIKNVYEKILQTVMRAMPDEQIQEILGNSQKYVVHQGVVYDMQSNPQQPKTCALRDMRTLKYDIELDATTKNEMLRNIKVQLWLQLHQAGVPIPLWMIAEAATDSRAEREQLREYAEQQAELQGKASQQQAQLLNTQIQHTLDTERGRVAEDTRHNIAQEQLEARKQIADLLAKLAAIWEKSDSSEKRVISDAFKALQQQKQATLQMAARSTPPGGMMQ